ncbi:MAG: RnfH family protein [Magnetococcales bacterium]|nr:RnfH family protein [Magnetococcales bacterium]MBF0322390.1 RnfH family protein [Magnetococcales bacterium]
MKIAVVYAEAAKQTVIEFEANDGITAAEAVERSGIMKKFPQITLESNKLGIFSKIVEPGQVLVAGDRVEIYRPALGKPPKKERAAKESDADADGEASATKSAKLAAAKKRVAAAKTKSDETKATAG